MSRKKIPKLDLSRYNNSDKLPVAIEKILLEALIVFNADVKKISEHFNINENIVSEVLIKYYSQISIIYDTNLRAKPLDEALNKSVTIMNKHISELKTAQDASETKSLRSSEISNLCKMVDRITSIRETAIRSYDATVNKLNNSLTSLKMAEARVEGPVENDTDYTENQTTVYDMLREFDSLEFKFGSKKPVLLIDSKTNEVKEYESLKALATELDTSPEYIRKKIDRKSLYKNKYLIRFKKNDDKGGT